jgi:hypothetical protein
MDTDKEDGKCRAPSVFIRVHPWFEFFSTSLSAVIKT